MIAQRRLGKSALLLVMSCGIGYALSTVVANLERYQFYTVRSIVTGKTSINLIVEDPGDKDAYLMIVTFFLSLGFLLSIGILKLYSKLRVCSKSRDEPYKSMRN
ncbi:hypothetical protein KIH39_19120 [Telmatocola sphagniphila]|uniref:Uncharacterized protein n=1 Tax=Telmatocola sphagniphila TaxID=1123043 RepID=A0A8E6B3A5_9BACT|nr:hypothetical protein [Telmatocola sphagniphila]QVL30946.1 hypothetical protein KIH39_19120 [Telmatocola sphagniphila]